MYCTSIGSKVTEAVKEKPFIIQGRELFNSIAKWDNNTLLSFVRAKSFFNKNNYIKKKVFGANDDEFLGLGYLVSIMLNFLAIL